MFTREDNELLTRVAPGTPMGALLREYWTPACLASEIAEPGSAPLRVRLFGEDLIAFRDSEGAVGLVEERCPHRQASLFFARNEAGGLRCVYHGWKFDRTGRCLDMPNEATDCPLKDKVRATAYPSVERNGVVWGYLGPRREPPPLPDFEWNGSGANEPFFFRYHRACNFLQCLEGELDSSHIGFLHRSLDPGEPSTVPGVSVGDAARPGLLLARKDLAPRIAVVETETGLVYSAARDAGDGREYHRVHPFLFPFHTMISGSLDGEASFNGKAWVPMDDERTLVLEWRFRPARSFSEAERAELVRLRAPHGFLPKTSQAAGAFMPRANAENDYFLDRSLEKDRLFCGILSNPLQDTAVQESMGAIVDRTREHLGPADTAIIALRRRLLAAARALRDHGTVPPGVDRPELYRVRPAGAVLPCDADWLAETRALREAGR